MAIANGPVWVGGTQSITKNGYTVVLVPDINNDQLQREGKPPVYYWLPNEVRLARKNGNSGDYKFSFIHFVGDDAAENEGKKTGGGLLSFSTITAPPGDVLQQVQNDLLDRFRGSSDYYWGWRNGVAPSLRPAPIVSNTMTITNLSPNANRSLPSVVTRGANRPRAIQMGGVPSYRSPKAPYAIDRAARAGNLDVWYANLQGEGQGSVLPTVENAFSGLVGSYPAALIWESFHSGTGGISVWQNLQIKVWSPVVHLKIEGHWQRIQEHFSAAGHAGGWFWSADIQVEFNNLVLDGTIKVTQQVDQTLPADVVARVTDQLNKTKDLVFTKFMEAAQKTIFDPAPFNEEPAQASGGFLGWGGGVAFKLRRDTVTLDLSYEEEQQFAYLQPYPISGQMEGLYDEIRNDPAAEKRYFRTIYLGDWEQDVARTFKPVANYPDPAREWVGQPVAFLSAQVGYPNVDGTLTWDGHMFQPTDPPDAVWNWKKSKKNASDVSNPPANWQPDRTYVKRQIHLTEPPSEFEYPYARVQVEKNVIDLDPGENGTLSNDINYEVRVESAGTLSVGPISLGVTLTDATQNVEVTFRAVGKDVNGVDHAPVKLLWKNGDQDTERFWMIYTGQLDFVPRYQYKVRVIVKGDLFSNGMEWEDGEWRDGAGSGPLIVSVPKRDAANVITRSLPSVVTGVQPALGAGTGTSTSSNGAGSTGSVGAPPASTTTTTPPAGAPVGSPHKSSPLVRSSLSSLHGYPLTSGSSGGSKAAPRSMPAETENSADHQEYDSIVPNFD